MPLKQWLLFLLFCAFVTGCSSGSNHPISTPLGSDTPRVISKTTIAGKSIRIDSLFSAHADCSVAEMGVIKVLQQPTHGTLTVSTRKDYPSFPERTQRAECNKKKILGIFADYTPDSAFVGNDSLVIEIITASGRDVTLKYLVAVK